MDALLKLDPATTALVVVDLQEKLLPAVVTPERVTRATRLLLRAAQVLWIPVVATTQYERGLGPLVEEVAELLPRDAVRLDKTAFSCFDDPRFDRLVREAAPRARTLVVAGIEAHICVAGTVRGALLHGFAVEVAVDAVSSRSEADREVALRRMEREGALLATSEMAVYELLGSSATAAFKEMLPWLKSGG